MKKAIIKNDKILKVSVPVAFFKMQHAKGVFAECPSLGIVTKGRNLKEAQANFKEAVDLFVEEVNENQNALDVLEELGWEIGKEVIVPSSFSCSVPVEILALSSKKLSFVKGC